jgi:hypothetical protein
MTEDIGGAGPYRVFRTGLSAAVPHLIRNRVMTNSATSRPLSTAIQTRTSFRRLCMCRTRVAVLCAALSGTLTVAGCFPQRHTSASSSSAENAQWLASGAIGVSRRIPQAATVDERTPVLGFMPSQHTQTAPRLVLDRAADRITVVSSAGTRSFDGARGWERLAPGSYSVALKQQAPLWYAPSSYFETRGLPTPAEGSTERFRRGALGTYTVFLNNKVPLHSGPHASAEVGGVQLPEPALRAIFEALEVGAQVEVR